MVSGNGTACAEKQRTEGRDGRGRFVRGNKGGPGNPYARKMAALKKALMDYVQPEDIVDVAIILMLQAKQGNHAAVKLLFSYVLGLPKDQVDPDRLDQDEWQIWMQSIISEKDIGQLDLGMPIDRVNGLAAERVAEQRAIFDSLYCPMTNGDNGQGEPSSNGSDGDHRRGEPTTNGCDGGHSPSANGAGEGRSAPMGTGADGGQGARAADGRTRAPKRKGSDGEQGGRRARKGNGPEGREPEAMAKGVGGEQEDPEMSAALYRSTMGHAQVLLEGAARAYQRGLEAPLDNGVNGEKGEEAEACFSEEGYRESVARMNKVEDVLEGTFLRQKGEPLEESIARVSREHEGR